jgi:hypothetical protein
VADDRRCLVAGRCGVVVRSFKFKVASSSLIEDRDSRNLLRCSLPYKVDGARFTVHQLPLMYPRIPHLVWRPRRRRFATIRALFICWVYRPWSLPTAWFDAPKIMSQTLCRFAQTQRVMLIGQSASNDFASDPSAASRRILDPSASLALAHSFLLLAAELR